jgi:hypothetical protein
MVRKVVIARNQAHERTFANLFVALGLPSADGWFERKHAAWVQFVKENSEPDGGVSLKMHIWRPQERQYEIEGVVATLANGLSVIDNDAQDQLKSLLIAELLQARTGDETFPPPVNAQHEKVFPGLLAKVYGLRPSAASVVGRCCAMLSNATQDKLVDVFTEEVIRKVGLPAPQH